jgi:NAD(P)-dependent dehydrogenase (short-subunit alcohol dehydrogenase family)
MNEAVIVHQPRGLGIDELENELLRVFSECRDVVVSGRPVVVVLREEDVTGHGEALDAAVAHALVGLVRGLAVEGVTEGWRINAISVGLDEQVGNWILWSHRLGTPEGANGVVLRLGTAHLGRVGL